jgi:hypothetical protein
LGICLFTTLADRLLSYTTHKAYREELNQRFDKWKPGTWRSAVISRTKIRYVKLLPMLKHVGFWSLLGGVILFMVGVLVGRKPTSPAPPPPPPPATTIVNVYAAATQPTVKH